MEIGEPIFEKAYIEITKLLFNNMTTNELLKVVTWDVYFGRTPLIQSVNNSVRNINIFAVR